MVENRPLLRLVTHLVLILGIVIIAIPIWLIVMVGPARAKVQ